MKTTEETASHKGSTQKPKKNTSLKATASNVTVLPVKAGRAKAAPKKKKELSVSARKKKYPLMWYIAAEAQHRGENPAQLADRLGIGYVYLTFLLRGKRQTERMGREALISCARYLDVPVAQAYLWAGALEPQDFVHEGHFKEMEGENIAVMSRHPDWGGFMPDIRTWNALPENVKIVIVMMYEQLTGLQLTDKTRIPE